MTTTTAAHVPGLRRLAAFIAQAMSYATTVSAAMFIIHPKSELDWAFTLLIALAFEIMFAMMKETLFSNLAHPAGWIGFFADALVNAGGAMPWAPRLLTFGPIALILGVFGVDVSDPTTGLVGGAVLSLIFGGVLSIVPHWLWRPARPKKQRGE